MPMVKRCGATCVHCPPRKCASAATARPERVSAGVKARLAELYPNDRATGYTVGQIRGAVTLKRTQP